jgi:hypothetical protein
MTDRRDPAEEDLRDRLDELESTLVELREQLDDDRRDTPRIPRGLPGGGRRPPRPPRLSEVLRFTEEYTIPTLISILEVNVRLLRLAGAALRALDPERSAVPADGDGAVSRAIDAGQGLSTDRLRRGLEDLNDALAGTEATDPEARELLSEAEELSAEIQDRLRDASESADSRRERSSGGQSEDDAVSIDVTDEENDGGPEPNEERDEAPEPDVDAELDSIREEVRGDDGENGAGDAAEDDEPGEDADGTAAE